MKVGGVPLEERVVAEHHHDVEIAGLAAGDAGLALARDTQPRAVLDARRDFHLDRLLAFDAAGAAAARAGIGDHFARPAAGVAGAVHAEEALLEHQLARAFAAPAARGFEPSAAPEPPHGSHFFIFGIFRLGSQPSSTSSRVISRLYRRSAPR